MIKEGSREATRIATAGKTNVEDTIKRPWWNKENMSEKRQPTMVSRRYKSSQFLYVSSQGKMP